MSCYFLYFLDFTHVAEVYETEVLLSWPKFFFFLKNAGPSHQFCSALSWETLSLREATSTGFCPEGTSLYASRGINSRICKTRFWIKGLNSFPIPEIHHSAIAESSQRNFLFILSVGSNALRTLAINFASTRAGKRSVLGVVDPVIEVARDLEATILHQADLPERILKYTTAPHALSNASRKP